VGDHTSRYHLEALEKLGGLCSPVGLDVGDDYVFSFSGEPVEFLEGRVCLPDARCRP
jgi:hypothetical protein